MGVTAKCPRCKGTISAIPDEQGFFVCPLCGARLRTAATPSVAAATTAAPGGRASAAAPAQAPQRESSVPSEALPVDIRALVKGQEESLQVLREILAIVRSQSGGAERGVPKRDDLGIFGGLGAEDSASPPQPLVRKRRRRKTVLLVDDDDEARRTTEAAFLAAHVPVRAVADGKAALAAIATEKPDVIILELGVSEPMTGRDVINMIKATMEWVDIPIVLYTRLPIVSQQEARTIHGADDLVLKGSANADMVVARAIQIFQREG